MILKNIVSLSLINNQIYAPLYSELNDPFEGLFEEQITEAVRLLERIFKADGNEVLKNFNEVTDYKTKFRNIFVIKNLL